MKLRNLKLESTVHMCTHVHACIDCIYVYSSRYEYIFFRIFIYYSNFAFGYVLGFSLVFQCRDGIQGLAHVKDTFCYLVILPSLNPPQALRLRLVSSSPLDYNKTVSCGPLDYKTIVV